MGKCASAWPRDTEWLVTLDAESKRISAPNTSGNGIPVAVHVYVAVPSASRGKAQVNDSNKRAEPMHLIKISQHDFLG